MTLSVALLLPWATGAVLVALDGRRRGVGWVAVAVLAATLAMLAVLAAQVLTSGGRVVLTGPWPAGVGIVLHADMLGVTFAVLSVLVLLAATAHEVLAGLRERGLPRSGAPARGRAERAVPHRRRVQLLRLLRTGDDGLLRAHHLRRRPAPAAGGDGVRRGQPARLVHLPALGGRHLPHDRRAGHARRGRADARRSTRMRRSSIADGLLRRVQRQARPVPLPLLAADGLRGHPARGRGDPQRRCGQHRRRTGCCASAPGCSRPQLRLAATALVVLGATSLVYGAVLAVARGDIARDRWPTPPSGRSGTCWSPSASAARSG